jgi:hypothetical protein
VTAGVPPLKVTSASTVTGRPPRPGENHDLRRPGHSTHFESLMRMLREIPDDPIDSDQSILFVSPIILQFFVVSKNRVHIHKSLQRSTRRNAMSRNLKGPCPEIQVSQAGQKASAGTVTDADSDSVTRTSESPRASLPVSSLQ